jgi:hypothetical protein
MGPMTGGGRGTCTGYAAPGRWVGSGFGGGGRRWRNWYYATGLPRWARRGVPPAAGPSRQQEIETLKDEAQALKERLEAVDARMDELSQEGTS